MAGANAASQVLRDDGNTAAWVYVIGYGGGLVSGDCLRVRAVVESNATAILTTQVGVICVCVGVLFLVFVRMMMS
jgi:hypothetical protein